MFGVKVFYFWNTPFFGFERIFERYGTFTWWFFLLRHTLSFFLFLLFVVLQRCAQMHLTLGSFLPAVLLQLSNLVQSLLNSIPWFFFMCSFNLNITLLLKSRTAISSGMKNPKQFFFTLTWPLMICGHSNGILFGAFSCSSISRNNSKCSEFVALLGCGLSIYMQSQLVLAWTIVLRWFVALRMNWP